MRSVPNSYLWLLSPSKLHGDEQLPANHSSLQILDNIRNMAKFHGISTNRLIFANRVDKAYHIQRQAAADLFLDTFFYGAHSTATDALRGGLPILTIQGGSFPERVASSLYQSLAEGSSQKSSKERLLENDAWDLDHEALMLQNTLVTFSIKDYISTAILLSKTKQGKKMDVLKSIVWRCVMAERGPFHAVEHNRKLLTSISAMEDEKILNQGILSKLNPTKLNKASNADDQFLFKHSPLFTSNKRWHLVITNV